MKELVLDYIQQYATLSEEEKEIILSLVVVETHKKGTILLKAGEISTAGFLILKGCVRQYYIVDGEEKTTAFYTEQQTVSYCNNPFAPMPSAYYLSCVEDTFALTCEGGEIDMEVYKKYPRFETICRMITEIQLSDTQEEFANFIVSSPEERYLNLLNNRPDLINRVPQHQLASFLGMKPESLSRIRKRITSKTIGLTR